MCQCNYLDLFFLFAILNLWCFLGPGLLHQKQHQHRQPDKRNQIHCQSAHREILLQCVGRGGPLHHCWNIGEPHLQHRRCILFFFPSCCCTGCMCNLLDTACSFIHSFQETYSSLSQHVCHSWRSQERSKRKCVFYTHLAFVWFLICSIVFYPCFNMMLCSHTGTGKGMGNFEMEMSQVGFSAHYSSKQVQSTVLYCLFYQLWQRKLTCFLHSNLQKHCGRTCNGCVLLVAVWNKIKEIQFEGSSDGTSLREFLHLWKDITAAIFLLNGILQYSACFVRSHVLYLAKAVCWWMATSFNYQSYENIYDNN